MVRNIVVLGGSSHPQLTQTICNHLGIPSADITLGKFAVGETRVEIQESVRGKDVYVIQSGGGKVNDHFMELLIIISACKTASATRVTAVLPLFPYSRQSDSPVSKVGAPLTKSAETAGAANSKEYTFNSRPQTPVPGGHPGSFGINDSNSENLHKQLSSKHVQQKPDGTGHQEFVTVESMSKEKRGEGSNQKQANGSSNLDYFGTPGGIKSGGSGPPVNSNAAKAHAFAPQAGYKEWVAQAGTLVADLLTCAGADHVITMDLHDPQYQGFFDIPVDNLYGRHLLKRYIEHEIPDFRQAVIVSPDAGGAKRATAVADQLGLPFGLIHKERRPTQVVKPRENASMILVGDVVGKTAILIDDLADTSNTITRAAKLLKREGAKKIYALVSHGILSGDAIDRINASALDHVVVTNSVAQDIHKQKCHKLEVLDVGTMFAEAIRRVHHGESISVLFQYDH